MTPELLNLVEERCLAQLKGMVASHLRGGNMRESTLAEIDSVARRAQFYGIADIKTKRAITAGIDASPNRFSQAAEIVRRRYMPCAQS